MKIKNFALLTLSAIMLWSCASDDDGLQPDPQPEVESQIKFEIGFAPQAVTRVATDANINSTWEVNDKIGLYIVKGNGGLKAAGNYVDNMEMTRQANGSWLYTFPSGKEYYPNDGDKLSFYAYYPYDAGMINPISYPFSIPTNQFNNNNDEAYRKHDFLWAKLENIARTENAVPLQFSHAMALIHVRMIWNNTNFVTSLLNVRTNCMINLRDQSIITGSVRSSIEMHRKIAGGGAEHMIMALIPPQTMDINMSWHVNNGHFVSTPATNVQCTSGSVKKYQISRL